MSIVTNMYNSDRIEPEGLTESFYWICDKDLFFAVEDGTETSYVTLKSRRSSETAKVLLLKRDNFYKIGFYEPPRFASVDFRNAAAPEEETFRHPLLFVQEHKLPANMPMNQFLLGPVKAINMTRILRLVQADLSHDKEMMEDIVHNLHLSYSDGGFAYLSNKFA